MSQSNAEIIRSAYEAFAAGDVPAVLAAMSPDITWNVPGRSPMAGTYTGPDEVLGFFQQLVERSNGTFNLDVHDVLDNGDNKVVLLLTELAQRDDKSLSMRAVHEWELRDGKATSFRGFVEDDHDWDDFFS